MKKLLLGWLFFYGFMLATQTLIKTREWQLRRTIEKRISDSLAVHAPVALHTGQKNPGMESLKNGFVLKERYIRHFLDSRPRTETLNPMLWHSGDASDILVVSAMGTDRKHHFANTYFQGFLPFHTDHLWIPQYTLALRKQYRRDHDLYPGFTDIWQSSEEAFRTLYGDCEDHAILLADWLCALGVDARVVLGTYHREGHAWVVAFHRDAVMLLEATSKEKISAWRHYPLAALATDYHPQYMFNAESFWVNTGIAYTTAYKSPLWEERARLVKGN